MNSIIQARYRQRHIYLRLAALATLAFVGLFLLSIFDPQTISKSSFKMMAWPKLTMRRTEKTRFAYVFYITSTDYTCYALVNAHRLIFDLKSDPRIDIVLLATNSSKIDRFCPELQCSFPPGRVKIKMVPREIVNLGQGLTQNLYYMESYVRFEAFGLYHEYDRLVILDADGFIMQNIDHLFKLDLGKFNVAAALSHYLSHDWITSICLVVDPSKDFYEHLISFLNPGNISKVAAFADGAHYDMDILNYALDRGNLTKLIPKYYALLDSYFFEDDDTTLRRENDLNKTYYIHFTIRKPLIYFADTRPWPLEVDATNTTDNSTIPSRTSYGFNEAVYYPFWTAFDRHCRVLVQRAPTIPPDIQESFGMVYPDPEMTREFLNNQTALMVGRL